MRTKTGILCMILGAALIFGALALFITNRMEETAADAASAQLLPQLQEEIEKHNMEQKQPQTYHQPVGTPVEFLEPESFEMTEVEIDGYAYIGYLSIPALELELPVMSTWDYSRLKIAPCRYSGSVRGEDFVIMAHNYARHFGILSNLSEGESILFTDMDGVVTAYEVVAQDVLSLYAVEEMTAGDYDLALFTCTYGGRSRITVYCDFAQ